ncbi:MAG: oligosaccharide flippase family protein [Bacteroidia bacterium]
MQALVKIVKGKSFTSLAGNAIGALLGLLTFAMLARYLNKEDFGIWIFFITTYGLFDTLRIGMIVNALIKNINACKSIDEENIVIGTAFYLAGIITLLFLAVLIVLYFVFLVFKILPEHINYLKWYAAVALFSLPHNFASWLMNAKLKIFEMSLVRALQQLVFIAMIYILVKPEPTIFNVLIGFIVSHVSLSLATIVFKSSGINHIFNKSKSIFKNIINFGKYSTGTLIGSNLLRSSNTYIITSMLGSAKNAVFNVPLRLIELIEMPLRSFAITALPQFAKLYSDKKLETLKYEFERRTGAIFFMLLPLSLVCLFFADFMVYILAGKGYEDSVILLKLFAIYTCILPLDKFSGIMLDVIDRPDLNFIKVMLMLAVNVIGGITVIYFFNSLEVLAIVSTLTFTTGTLYGFVMINKHLNVSFLNIFKLGFNDLYEKSLSIIKFK